MIRKRAYIIKKTKFTGRIKMGFDSQWQRINKKKKIKSQKRESFKVEKWRERERQWYLLPYEVQFSRKIERKFLGVLSKKKKKKKEFQSQKTRTICHLREIFFVLTTCATRRTGIFRFFRFLPVFLFSLESTSKFTSSPGCHLLFTPTWHKFIGAAWV